METMINETLDYFRDASVEEKAQRFDLIGMLRSIVEDAQDMSYQVSFKCKLDSLVYRGQINLLKRALVNLINNAVYYGKEATVSLSTTNDKINITIEDRGEGLSDQALEQAFTPFFRAESSRSRQTGGTGLGLTIAKEIIQNHQGKITLGNRPQGGLKVTIILPLHQKLP